MKKTIVVATDFSITALNAANYAADMAVLLNADLHLLHVCQLLVTYVDMPIALTTGDIEEVAEKDMNKFKQFLLAGRDNTLNVTSELQWGDFFSELKETCERIRPYVVIMGSQGTTAAERILLGGHAVHAMKHLQWPLITVPAEVQFSGIKKIALATDFDKVIDTVPTDEIKLLVRDFNAELHVINTGRQKVFNADIVFESGLMQEMFTGLQPQYHFIAHEDTDQGIIEYTEQNQIDLLMVFPKHHDFIERMMHRSHTKHLVLHSHVPVMALHQ
jgi:nucleotide-binding universal stress UspA family protein